MRSCKIFGLNLLGNRTQVSTSEACDVTTWPSDQLAAYHWSIDSLHVTADELIGKTAVRRVVFDLHIGL